jgi:membrane protein
MKFRFRRYLYQFPVLSRVRAVLKRIHFRKYDNLSLYYLGRVFVERIWRNNLFTRANAVSFNFVLAIFPLVIFLFTLIPYISAWIPEVNSSSIMSFLGNVLPHSMFVVIEDTVYDIVSNQRGDLLTFGFLFSFLLASNGMQSLMAAFNASYKTVERRGWIRTRIISMGLTVLLAIMLILAVILLVGGQIALNYVTITVPEIRRLHLADYNIEMLLAVRFAVIFIVFFLAISCIYYFGPAIHYNWKFFSKGSLLATLTSLALSYGFSYYITKFGTYNKVYGSIGVLIALMIWIQLLTIVLLFVYEMKASTHYAVRHHAVERHRRRMLKQKRLEF